MDEEEVARVVELAVKEEVDAVDHRVARWLTDELAGQAQALAYACHFFARKCGLDWRELMDGLAAEVARARAAEEPACERSALLALAEALRARARPSRAT